jgi:imidazoleglycerol-phosphate dehydratase / histidinol-phosphatase
MRVLFIDRDGTIIREPADFQIDAFEKLSLLPAVIHSLRKLVEAGYVLVMVSNQDGMGTDWPEDRFWPVHNFLLELLEGEGVHFQEVFIDRHHAAENHPNRKPGTGMLLGFLGENEVDMVHSFVIGDRRTDALLAQNLGCRSLTIKDPKSNDGDLRQPDAPGAPTTLFTMWDALVSHILQEE